MTAVEERDCGDCPDRCEECDDEEAEDVGEGGVFNVGMFTDEVGQDPPYGDEGDNFQEAKKCEKGSGPHDCGVGEYGRFY